jgi:hypothetical protein
MIARRGKADRNAIRIAINTFFYFIASHSG